MTETIEVLTRATISGVTFMVTAAGALLLAAALLALASYLASIAGEQLWRRMRRVYRLATLWQYLNDLEKTGRYHFPKPDKDNP